MPPEQNPTTPQPEHLEPILEAHLMQTQETNHLLEALITQNKEQNTEVILEALLVSLKDMASKFEASDLAEGQKEDAKYNEILDAQGIIIHLLQKIESKEITIPPHSPTDMTLTNQLIGEVINEMQKPCEIELTLNLI